MLTVQGKPLFITRHAFDGMNQERPPVKEEDVIQALEEPDSDDGSTATKRKGGRTIIVRYTEREEDWLIRGVSATQRSL